VSPASFAPSSTCQIRCILSGWFGGLVVGFTFRPSARLGRRGAARPRDLRMRAGRAAPAAELHGRNRRRGKFGHCSGHFRTPIGTPRPIGARAPTARGTGPRFDQVG
jgi:hypothetical protein